ncbi:ATP-dependent DNA helicase RecG [Bauldia litoralis]|uniref:ATP-dependent DNA helicase RecG n=1 Tax=Bauldia litoralis TaxID=665467 RepID=A0A1G6B3Z8_9HYPH|nr:ATP-dependent DNA helicase RecG [Bauldia litoralis]SDB15377.1 ATP-dependent DNA helicase RecG [Bauldia litoralis]
MRPPVLNPLFRPVSSLAGIGPKLAVTLRKLLGGPDPDGEPRAIDLLFHLPVAVIDRSRQPGIALSPEGAIVTLKVRIDRHQKPPRGNRRIPYRVFVHDDTGELALTFFHANEPWLERMLPIGETRYVSGRMEWFNGRPSMVHPDHMVSEADFGDLPLIEPVYPMTAGLARKTLLKAVGDALDGLPDLPEWLDSSVVAEHHWTTFGAALRAAHHPTAVADIEPHSPALARLAYDELLASQLALALMRAHQRRSAGKARKGDGGLRAKILDALPFTLTGSQQTALAEIDADLAQPERMLRLLQGDVGSGKTVVALLSAATTIEAGAQAAIMAPTELLVRQHARTIAPLAEVAGIRLAVLTGRERARDRAEVVAGLADGSIDLLVGTHALFQSGVEFRDLGLVVVDEQHRFGVHQRLALTAKGEATDVLVMTATPIPRTLVLTYYGDMDVSRLTEKPAGRRPIETRAIPLTRLDEVVERVRAATVDGAKAYWVCPLVEESEVLDVAAVEERYATLTAALGGGIGLVHGRMSAADRDVEMAKFVSGESKVLVATTVVEVGVDVSDATIMVIEHAERFGLAQLHQLRGRVGRSDRPSVCLLLYKGPLGPVATDRLRIMRESEDGFVIAEEDLRLRGGGEVLGTRQSGTPGFRIADLDHHADLMEAARDDARLIVDQDANLGSERGAALRLLLYVFGRDDAVRLLRAG